MHSFFYDWIIVVYACSVLLYFIDFIQHNRKVNQLAFWLLSIVWVSQTTYIIYQIIEHQAYPVFSRFDTLFFYSWVLITISLIINWFYKMDLFLFFTNIVGFTIISMSLFVSHEMPHEMAEQYEAEWLIIHISMAFLSYALFTLSFIVSVWYLAQHRLLKKKKFSKQFRRGASLGQLESITYYLNLVGFPMLLLSLILGLIWAYHLVTPLVFLDIKVIFSLIVLIMYGIYLYKRMFSGWTGKRIIQLNCICFIVLLVNYLLSSFFSHFHLWN